MKTSAKRTNFINIQQDHVVAVNGYTPSPLRTGYEQVIAQRCSDLFAYSAKGKGKIDKVTGDFVSVVYDDPDLPEDRVELGRRYGVVPGKTVPHDVVCDLAPGTKVKEGDVISFNTGFFERNYINPTQVVWKSGVMAKTALLESADTFEDSSAISSGLSGRMVMQSTKVRELILRSEQNILNLVQTGEILTGDSILCNIQDPVNEQDVLSAEVASTLDILARNSPRAKYEGKVNKIEVLYNGELEDMSDSIRDLVNRQDKVRKRKALALNNDVTEGRAGDLDLDTVTVKIYIDTTLGMGDGDKAVFGNQLKTVVRRVFDSATTESGEDIDAYFSYDSVNSRIVQSPEIMGTTNVLLKLAGLKAAEAYRNK